MTRRHNADSSISCLGEGPAPDPSRDLGMTRLRVSYGGWGRCRRGNRPAPIPLLRPFDSAQGERNAPPLGMGAVREGGGRANPRFLAGHRDDRANEGLGVTRRLGWGSGGKRKPRSTSAYGRPGGQPGSFGARRLHGFRKRNPGGRPLRVKPFTLQTPHKSVYHQYPIDHLLSECNSNINAIAVRAQYRAGANFDCC